MIHTRLWVAATIIALVLVAGFALSVPHTRDIASPTTLSAEASRVPSVNLRDVFKKGVHTISGSIKVPNVCTIVTTNAHTIGDASNTERILVEISIPKDTGVCLQLPTSIKFSVTASAPASVPITAIVNGSEASTTVL